MNYGLMKSHPHVSLDMHVESLLRYYRNFKSKGYRTDMEEAIVFHDWGKQNKYFRERMDGLEEGIKLSRKIRFDKHAVLSAMRYLLEGGGVGFGKLRVINMILGHHGSLINYNELIDKMYDYIDDEDLIKSYTTIEGIDRDKYRGLILEAEDTWYGMSEGLDVIDGVSIRNQYSQLVDADRLSAMRGSVYNHDDLREERFNNEASFYINNIKNKARNPLDKIRNEISLDLTEILSRKKGIFTYTLPTGLGKTIGSVKIAEKINEKVIYVVPYLTVSDQTYDVYNDIYKYRNRRGYWDFLVKHDSRLNHQDYIKSNYDEKLRTKDMIENWHSKMIITTTVQFFESLLDIGSRRLRKIHNTYGATILIDEPQSIPFEKWKFLKEVVKGYAEELDWKVIYLSATPPKMDKGVNNIVKNEEHIFSLLGRTELEYIGRKDGFQGVKDWSEEAWGLTREKRQVLWLVNIEKLARKLYLYAHKLVRDRDIVFISGKLPPIVRNYKIRKLRERMDMGEKVLVISTQVLEAGVDLDFDGIVRDLAPLPTLIQVAGRLNRRWLRGRERLYVMQLLDNTVYSDFEFRHTGEVLGQRGNLIKEEDYYEVCEHYYELCEEMPPSETPGEWMDQFVYLRECSMEMIESVDYQGTAVCVNVEEWLLRADEEEREEFYNVVKEVTGYEYRPVLKVLEEISEFGEYLSDLKEGVEESVELLSGLQRYVGWFGSTCNKEEIEVYSIGDKVFDCMSMPPMLLKYSRSEDEIDKEVTRYDLGLNNK